MPYVKPGTTVSSVGPAASSDSDYLSVDGVAPVFGAAVVETSGGFGVVDTNTNTVEILDALPLGRTAIQTVVGGAYTGSTKPSGTADSDYVGHL